MGHDCEEGDQEESSLAPSTSQPLHVLPSPPQTTTTPSQHSQLSSSHNKHTHTPTVSCHAIVPSSLGGDDVQPGDMV